MNQPRELEACRIARHALRSYYRAGVFDDGPEIAPPELAAPAPVFVLLWSGGQLRGCMGSRIAFARSAAHQIALTALQAATSDPLRRPLHPSELDMLDIGVSVLGPARDLAAGDWPRPDEALEVQSASGLVGLALPGWGREGDARAAAGIGSEEPVVRRALAVTAYGGRP